jgi:hypothetical protein
MPFSCFPPASPAAARRSGEAESGICAV